MRFKPLTHQGTPSAIRSENVIQNKALCLFLCNILQIYSYVVFCNYCAIFSLFLVYCWQTAADNLLSAMYVWDNKVDFDFWHTENISINSKGQCCLEKDHRALFALIWLNFRLFKSVFIYLKLPMFQLYSHNSPDGFKQRPARLFQLIQTNLSIAAPGKFNI